MENRRSYLALFPPPPFPPAADLLKAAYDPPVVSILQKLAQITHSTSKGVVLDIAISCPHLANEALPRTLLFQETQSIVAGLCKIICIVSAKEGFNVEDAEGIDVRIVLLTHPHEGGFSASTESPSSRRCFGPVVSLQALASSKRPWSSIFGVEGEQGERLVQEFLAASRRGMDVVRIRGGITQIDTTGTKMDTQTHRAVQRHTSVAVGGTFDHLHIGHKLLLTMTAFLLEGAEGSSHTIDLTATIGITGDQLLKNKKYREFLQDWDARQQAVKSFLTAIIDFRPPAMHNVLSEEMKDSGPNGHQVVLRFNDYLSYRCVEIWDPFGPTITDKSISALVISAETRAGGAAVNKQRAEKGWASLEVYEVDVLDAEEAQEAKEKGEDAPSVQVAFQSKLSSTEIRRRISQKATSTAG